MAHTLQLSTAVRSTRRDVRRRADAVEFQVRREAAVALQPTELDRPHRRTITVTEWLGAGVLWSFVAVMVIGLFVR